MSTFAPQPTVISREWPVSFQKGASRAIGAQQFFAKGRDNQLLASRDPLPMTAEEFFQLGEDTTAVANCTHCCCDVQRICCSPSSCLHPSANVICLLCKNCCCAPAARGVFYPTWCPCGCCPVPCKTISFACPCCATPAERCDSLRFWAQRLLWSVSADAIRLYPPDDDAPSKERPANEFVAVAESLADLLTSVPCLTRCLLANGKNAWAPHTRWQPASEFVGNPDEQMNDSAHEGGWWVYPDRFSELPTPPKATDEAGHPLPTNVQPGDVGSRVIFWAHGSAFALTQAKDFVWLCGQLLCEQTGQVVLIGEYGLSSSTFHPAQLNQWIADYKTLCRLYGAENVIVAGDSAGGNLSLATLLQTHAELPPPAALALFSPWVDLSPSALTSASVAANNPYAGGLPRYGKADYLPVPAIELCQDAYAAAVERTASTAVSPGLASVDELRALGRQAVGADGQPYTMKVFLTFGTEEVLYDQCASLGQKLGAADLQPTVYESEGMPHDSAILASLVYNTDCHCVYADYSTFEPIRIWAEYFRWVQKVPGWQDTKVPPGWEA